MSLRSSSRENSSTKLNLEIDAERSSLMREGDDEEDHGRGAAAAHSNNSHSSSSSSSKTCCTRYTVVQLIVVIVLFALSGAVIVLKMNYDQRLTQLETLLANTQLRLDAVESTTSYKLLGFDNRVSSMELHEKDFQTKALMEIVKQNTSSTHELSVIRKAIDEHQSLLVRLSNGTSNADVLDKLEETKVVVRNQLTSTQSHLESKLAQAERNVTTLLDSKVYEMQHVVSKATTNINEMEKNVTGRLNSMSNKLIVTVDEVNHSVADAQVTISEEVEGVRENIRQYVAITNQQFAAENDFVKYELAGFFTLLGCLIFLWHMTSHSSHYHKPDVQRRVMAVLWMVPIYGITSWLSLVYPTSEPYFATIRDCFEAYVVYTFLGFLIAILSDGMTFNQLLRKLSKLVEHEKEAVEKYKHHQSLPLQEAAESLPGAEAVVSLTKPKEHLVPPFPCCFQENDCRSIASAWLYQCQLMALQFVIMKPLLTLVPLLVALSGAYDMDKDSPWGDNTLNWESPKLYIMFFQNVSVMIAFYGLLSLFHGVEKDLEWCDPWPKFLCIKGVVFATFWQNIAIQGMTMFDLLDERAASQISNLLICIEMLIASIAHIYIFPYQEWEPGYQKVKERTIQIRDTMALGDFLQDMKRMVTKWEPDKVNKSTPDQKDHFEPLVAKPDEEAAKGNRNPLIRDDGMEFDKLLHNEPNADYTNFDQEQDVSRMLQEEFQRRVQNLSMKGDDSQYYQSQDSEDRASV